MPHLVNNSCAEDAVDDDVEKSPKTRKQVAVCLYADKTVNQAHQLFNNTLNPNQEYPRMGAEQAIKICALAGKASSYMRYVFGQLSELFNSEDSKEYLLLVFSTLMKKLSLDDAEVFSTIINEALGFKPPERLENSSNTLEGEKAILTNQMYKDIKVLYEKLEKIELLDKKLRPQNYS